jgi:hypothetical protein
MRTIRPYVTANMNRETGRKTHLEFVDSQPQLESVYFKQMIRSSAKAIKSIEKQTGIPCKVLTKKKAIDSIASMRKVA